MKRICIVLSFLLILGLCGCSNQQEELEEPTNFYYCTKEISYNNQSGVISAEEREASNFHGDLEALLNAYLLGPYSPELQTLIPADTTVLSCTISENTINIIVSEQFAKLSGIKLSAACSCMLMTIHDYAGLDALCVSVENGILDEKDEITITMDDILLMDTFEPEGLKE